MLVVLLDPYHLGDPLFITQLARDVQARSGGLVLVHGSAERGERALEALGAVAVEEDGRWRTGTEPERAAVERAMRELNRQVVHELNENGVSAVRVTGANRGLLRVVDGAVAAGETAWVRRLVEQGVVLVAAALVEADGGTLVEVDAAAAAAVLADALGAEAVVALAARRSVPEGTSALRSVGRDLYPDADLLGRAVRQAGRVWLAAPAALRDPGRPAGAWVEEGAADV